LLTGMTGISLHMQWPLTSQLHGSVSQREQLFFSLRIKLHANSGLLSYGHILYNCSTVTRSTGNPLRAIILGQKSNLLQSRRGVPDDVPAFLSSLASLSSLAAFVNARKANLKTKQFVMIAVIFSGSWFFYSKSRPALRWREPGLVYH
jgi:hypothetical protein